MTAKIKWLTIFFCLIHLLVVWISVKISNIVVDLMRLNEFSNYILTPEEERAFLYLFSGMMFIVTILFIAFIVPFTKNRNASMFARINLSLFAFTVLGLSVI